MLVFITFGYQSMLHIMPFVCTLSNILLTDMSIEMSHWWISVVVMFPCYTICNYIGAMDLFPDRGTIYGFENWIDGVPLTIFLFCLVGFLQGGMHACSAWCFNKCFPDGWNDEDDPRNQKTDEEKASNQVN